MNTNRTVAKYLGLILFAALVIAVALSCGGVPIQQHVPRIARADASPVQGDLLVRNENFYDAVVYVTTHGGSRRLADVPGHSTRQVAIHVTDLDAAGRLTLSIRMIGSGALVAIDGTYVARGSRPELTIATYLPASNLAAYR